MHHHNTERGHLTIERTFEAAPDRVFRAFATEAGLKAWWSPGPGVTLDLEAFDFRKGGVTKSVFTAPDQVFRNHLRYEDIVKNRRIVAAMTMWNDNGDTSSVNVLSIDFLEEGDGCRLVVGEHGAFLDGLESSAGHSGGLSHMLDSLATALQDATAMA